MPDQQAQDPWPGPKPEFIPDFAKCVPPSVPIDTLLLLIMKLLYLKVSSFFKWRKHPLLVA